MAAALAKGATGGGSSGGSGGGSIGGGAGRIGASDASWGGGGGGGGGGGSGSGSGAPRSGGGCGGEGELLPGQRAGEEGGAVAGQGLLRGGRGGKSVGRPAGGADGGEARGTDSSLSANCLVPSPRSVVVVTTCLLPCPVVASNCPSCSHNLLCTQVAASHISWTSQDQPEHSCFLLCSGWFLLCSGCLGTKLACSSIARSLFRCSAVRRSAVRCSTVHAPSVSAQHTLTAGLPLPTNTH